ncbi:MAG: hypothetical protein EXS15_03415 [Phycisphaerales bacterium]|nr:hypothetical protein [Phycisphaerales bacterium]
MKRTPRAFALMEVVIAGIILAIGLGSIVSLAARALMDQQRGERAVIAAALLDELLASVLVDGPEDWPKLHDRSGACDSPWADFEYQVDIEKAEPGEPCDVLAIIRDPVGREFRCATRIALRLGDEPNPDRMPSEAIDRQAYFDSKAEGSSAPK